MKYAVYLGKENIEIKEAAKPKVGKNDVLVKNIYSSICGTDVAVFTQGPNTGHKITVGKEFGHETVSRIVEIGENVTDFTIGERVYPYPLFVKQDYSRAGTIGGFSEYMLVENAKKYYNLYPINDQISDKLACLIEPFTVGCRAARRGMIPNGKINDKTVYISGEHAVVFGAGTIGIAAAIAFRYFGMRKVMVCDISDFRLHIAKNFGFETCNVSTENFEEKSIACFGEANSLSGKTSNIDCWLDAAGSDSILEKFMRVGKIESRFVSVAVNKSVRNLDLLHMTYSQKSIIGSGGYMPEDVFDVQKIMTCGKWNIESMITHEFPLEELDKAIRTASNVNISGNVIIKIA